MSKVQKSANSRKPSTINVSEIINSEDESIVNIDENSITEEEVQQELIQEEEKEKKGKGKGKEHHEFEKVPFFTGLIDDMLQGTITNFNPEKGFGFINGGVRGPLYFHAQQFRQVESTGSSIRVVAQSDQEKDSFIISQVKPGDEVLFAVRIHEKGPYASPWVLVDSVKKLKEEMANKKLYKCIAMIRQVVANNKTKQFEETDPTEVEICVGQEKVDFKLAIKNLVTKERGSNITFRWEVFDEEELEFVACEKPF